MVLEAVDGGGGLTSQVKRDVESTSIGVWLLAWVWEGTVLALAAKIVWVCAS